MRKSCRLWKLPICQHQTYCPTRGSSPTAMKETLGHQSSSVSSSIVSLFSFVLSRLSSACFVDLHRGCFIAAALRVVAKGSALSVPALARLPHWGHNQRPKIRVSIWPTVGSQSTRQNQDPRQRRGTGFQFTTSQSSFLAASWPCSQLSLLLLLITLISNLLCTRDQGQPLRFSPLCFSDYVPNACAICFSVTWKKPCER